MSGYALRSPELGWFVRRDDDDGSDVFSSNLTDACIFSDEDQAVTYGMFLCDRLDGRVFWVYGVSRLPRRWRCN